MISFTEFLKTIQLMVLIVYKIYFTINLFVEVFTQLLFLLKVNDEAFKVFGKGLLS